MATTTSARLAIGQADLNGRDMARSLKYVCTVREAAYLQGFPPDYEFRSDLPATKKQVANAVPPPVAKAILEEVKRSSMRTNASRRS